MIGWILSIILAVIITALWITRPRKPRNVQQILLDAKRDQNDPDITSSINRLISTLPRRRH